MYVLKVEMVLTYNIVGRRANPLFSRCGTTYCFIYNMMSELFSTSGILKFLEMSNDFCFSDRNFKKALNFNDQQTQFNKLINQLHKSIFFL